MKTHVSRGLIGLVIFSLSACTAPDHTGVLIDSRGLPTVINCGSWISSVVAKDAENDSTVWAAEAIPAEGGGINDVAEVRVGELPAGDWRELRSLAPEAPPSVWQVEVVSFGEPLTITAPSEATRKDIVYRPNGMESLARFDEHTCSGLPFSLSLNQYRVAVAALFLAPLGMLAIYVWRRRRAEEAAGRPNIG